ncbi:protein pleiotropic regulatory locus 1-like [Silene latifolia]|uniref:protein pleiotropic regulatory locus 1-like n=1 Tax=Silene latifolia TaxID=37657 RepID=UPI003D779CE9
MEVVEAQSLKKRSLDCFSPRHDSKTIRLSHKMKLEYGGIIEPSIKPQDTNQDQTSSLSTPSGSTDRFSTSALTEKVSSRWPRPDWHRPWKIYRVITGGHLGWVRAVAFDPSNNWFCTGSADRTIKVWDVASGQLKL